MMAQKTAAAHTTDGMIKVNGAELFYHARGSGPTILLIHGTGLDSGCYDEVAERLASDFKVLTYDRRGYSRSPRPSGWEKTSVEEQADDAAWLLRATANAPAVVFGSSSGALIAFELVLRHPDVVRGAVLHEPSVYSCLPQNFVQEQFAALNPMIEQAMASGGPQAAHRTLYGVLAGKGGFDTLVDARRRERWLRNSEFMFGCEFPKMILGYRPDPAAIAAVKVPVKVMRAAETLPINLAAAEWLAAQLKTDLVVAPGAHLAYCTQPEEFAEELRPVLRTAAG
jgi:pimeloyl-ACP methyl ester carboxylesterase